MARLEELEMPASNGGRALGAFLCGLGLGIAASTLLAPRSGKATRRLIGRKAQDLRNVACDTADVMTEAIADIGAQVTDTVTDVRDQVSGTVKEAKTRLREAVDAGRKAYRDELGKDIARV